jgi:hypothetical protein
MIHFNSEHLFEHLHSRNHQIVTPQIHPTPVRNRVVNCRVVSHPLVNYYVPIQPQMNPWRNRILKLLRRRKRKYHQLEKLYSTIS